jgi:hypothetical protein
MKTMVKQFAITPRIILSGIGRNVIDNTLGNITSVCINENRHMIKIIILLFFLVNILTFAQENENLNGNNPQNQNDIHVSLSIDKNIYLEMENIPIFIKIKSYENKTDSIKNLSGYTFGSNMNLRNDAGVLHYSFVIGDIAYDTYSPILAGQDIYYHDDLRSSYGSIKQEAFYESEKTYLPPGNYNVTLLTDKKIFGANLSSDTLSFHIIYPSGNELSALNDLRDIYKIAPITERSIKFREFLYKYPESAYLDQAFAGYLFAIRLDTNQTALSNTIIADCKWFIDRRPDSPNMPSVMRNCCKWIEKYYGKSDELEYMENITQRYPDTRAGYDAKVILSEIKN